MRRRTFAFGLALSGCTTDRRPRLNVFNWSSYIAPETVPDFEKEFGVRVRYGLYESNEEMLAKVMTGNSGWDIVFPTHSRIQPMVRNNLLARLDHSRLRNLDPTWTRSSAIRSGTPTSITAFPTCGMRRALSTIRRSRRRLPGPTSGAPI